MLNFLIYSYFLVLLFLLLKLIFTISVFFFLRCLHQQSMLKILNKTQMCSYRHRNFKSFCVLIHFLIALYWDERRRRSEKQEQRKFESQNESSLSAAECSFVESFYHPRSSGNVYFAFLHE